MPSDGLHGHDRDAFFTQAAGGLMPQVVEGQATIPAFFMAFV